MMPAPAFILPPRPETRSTALVEISGRQKVMRLGLFFTTIDRHVRSVYQQLDGETILADECRCTVNWGSNVWRAKRPFSVTRSLECPIDQHGIAARHPEVA